MNKAKTSSIEVQGTAIGILTQPGGDNISLTDMVRNFDGVGALIEQWLKNKDTVLFLGVWERINNPVFNSLEFEGIRNQAGLNNYTNLAVCQPDAISLELDGFWRTSTINPLQ